jgi:ADP-ribose pyrophosphatase YjhB (NUDIX family)
MSKQIAFRGKIFEIEQTTQPDGRVFERAVRAPGVRLIVADKQAQKVLLTKEFRSELNAWDYRLPGGKVFDTLAEYDEFREGNGDMAEAAERKAKAEGAEEAGVDVKAVQLFKKSTLGATVEWDLWVFDVTDWAESADGQALDEGEQIEAGNWFDYDEAKKMILDGQMQEERVALILLQWLKTQEG